MERVLAPFTIPLAGSKLGITSFQLSCDDTFFACFEESPVERGEIVVNLTLDKRVDMSLMRFELEGRVAGNCDRCLADIRLPLEGDYDLILKNGAAYAEEDELVILPPEMTEINVARFIYEFIILSLPVRWIYPCEEDDPQPCQRDVLDYLHRESSKPIGQEPTGDNPFGHLINKLNEN